jgi:simple sugar transport system permease protein
MDLSSINPVLLLASLMVAATPIMLAAIGELVVERAGVLNLGVEGMMITGAVCGFVVAVGTNSPWLGFVGAAIGGALISLIFGFLTQFLLSNQVATGLALTLFGLGLSALMGQGYIGIKAPSFPDWHIPILGDIPVIGPIVFQHDPMVYVGIALVAAVWAFLRYSRAGLILRAVGENHEAAHALGYHVVRVRMLAIMFGGACAGLGGAYLSLVRVPQWTEGMTAGAGWTCARVTGPIFPCLTLRRQQDHQGETHDNENTTGQCCARTWPCNRGHRPRHHDRWLCLRRADRRRRLDI